MKDAVFSGRDVAEALQAGGRALGLPPDALRYVVLDRGAPGVLGMGGTPARIAILLDSLEPAKGAPAAHEAGSGPTEEEREESRDDPRAGLRRILRALAEAAGLEIDVGIEEAADILTVRLGGVGREFFLGAGGETLKATEHLLQRMFARDIAPRRLVVDCEGYRELRGERLRALALELAAAVRRDGAPRTTGPLNAYERRIVHIALSQEPGIRTYSVGEGAERRVTVAPAEETSSGDGPRG